MAHAQRLALTQLAALLVACGQTHVENDAGRDAGSIDAGADAGRADAATRDGGFDGTDAGRDAGRPDAGPPCTGTYALAGSPLDLTGIEPHNDSILRTARGWAWTVESEGVHELYEVDSGFGGLRGPLRVSALPFVLEGDELPRGGVSRGPYDAGADRWLILLGRPFSTGAYYAVTIDTTAALRGGPWVLWPAGVAARAGVVAHGVTPAGFELLWYEDTSSTPSCRTSRLTVMHVALDGTTSTEAPVDIEGIPLAYWRDDRFFLMIGRGCAPDIVETVAQIDTSGALVGPRDVSGLPVTAGHRWRLAQDGPWIALGSHPVDMAVTESVTVTFVDPLTGLALGPPFEAWNRGASNLLLEHWGRVTRLPDGSYGWRLSAMDTSSPFGGQDLFVRFNGSRVLQTIVLGEARRGYPIRQLDVHLDGSATTTWIESTGRLVGDELVCGTM